MCVCRDAHLSVVDTVSSDEIAHGRTLSSKRDSGDLTIFLLAIKASTLLNYLIAI